MDWTNIENNKKTLIRLTPPQTILLGFAAMILIGAFLLTLPIADKSGESTGFLNALFTATSANCVTGLVVVNTLENWTWFGKLVILILIQFGALGFITVLTFGMLLLRRQISLRNRVVIQASFNQNSIGGMVKLVKKVILITLIIEIIGAILLTFIFYNSSSITIFKAVYQGIFHSVSAFCNAGFDIISTDSLTPFRDNSAINFTIMVLIVSGGIGFTVWIELIESFKKRKTHSLKTRILHLSLHSKIVFTVTGILIILGTALFLLLEWTNPKTLGELSIWHKIQAALFQSVTLRTCGFNTINQASLTEMSKLFSCILMFIGGSSASAAGGIKTVTLGIIVISIISVLNGRNRLEAFGRSLPLDLLQKALTVAGTMFIVIFASILILYFTEKESLFSHNLLDLLFESCSAAGTVGVSTGITPYLSPAGKMVIIFCMFLGRLGPITVVVALNMKLHERKDNIAFPGEQVIIG